jgi:methanethiol S-methyltransferase
MKKLSRIVVAALFGGACHLAFTVAIAMMAYEIYYGFTRGIYPLGGPESRWLNFVLLLQFPLLHSFLLSKRGRRVLAVVSPLGADMSTTTFALLSSLQLIAIFGLWTPAPGVWFEPHGAVLAVWSFCFAAAWLFLAKAIIDSNLALHSGFLGWWAVVRGKKPRFAPPSDRGCLKLIRQPIYLAFALILFLGPIWSLDHFIFAAVWGSYCLIAPVMKERRIRQWHGDWYEDYQKRVPYMIPRLGGSRGVSSHRPVPLSTSTGNPHASSGKPR